MIYWLGYYLAFFLSFLFFPRTIVGAENIPKGGSCIFTSNHLSVLDPFIIGLCCRYRVGYVAKDSLFKNKVGAFLLYKVEAFPIRRESTDVRAIREALRRLKRGMPLLIFPEGTRKRDAGPKSAQQGIGFIAVKSKVPVIPVFIKDSDKVLGPGGRFFKRHRVTISFGKPVPINRENSYQEISNQIMQSIEQLG